MFFFSRMCVFLLSRFSLVAVNKAFYCGAVSAIADTVSVQGVPVPGPNPQTNSKEGQGQPLPLLSLGIEAEELYLTLKLYVSRLHVCDSFRSERWNTEQAFKHLRVCVCVRECVRACVYVNSINYGFFETLLNVSLVKQKCCNVWNDMSALNPLPLSEHLSVDAGWRASGFKNSSFLPDIHINTLNLETTESNKI